MENESQIPYLIFIVSNPCCPKNISFMNENNPNHTTGVMSTPKAGGTDPLNSLNSGSVGQTTILNGTSLTFVDGYHERTMRHSMAKEKKFRNGPRTNDSGTTHASVSDNTIDGNETDVSDAVDAMIDAGSRSVVVKSPSIIHGDDARRGRRPGAPRVVSENVDDGEFVDVVVVVVDRSAG